MKVQALGESATGVVISKQARKHAIGLAGEFLVAGELLRRGIMAAVTYGNAKKADVVAVRGDRATSLEVKTTSESKWVLGGALPEDSSNLWVLVHLPAAETEPPDYFILTGAELRLIVLPQHVGVQWRCNGPFHARRGARGVVCWSGWLPKCNGRLSRARRD